MTDSITLRFERAAGKPRTATYRHEDLEALRVRALQAITEALGVVEIDEDGNAFPTEDGHEFVSCHVTKGPFKMVDICPGAVAEDQGPESEPTDNAPVEPEDEEPSIKGSDDDGWTVECQHQGNDIEAGPFPTRELAEGFIQRLISHPRAASRKRPKTPRPDGELTERFAQTTVEFHGEPEDVKLPKQAKALIECMRALLKGNSKGSLAQGDIVKALPKHVSTVQEPRRIWTFYRKALEEAGVITVTK